LEDDVCHPECQEALFAGRGQEAEHVGSSQADKAASHERIVKAAAARIRRDGVEGVGVADLMREAGLTHGGFYRHFGSRDELVDESIVRA
jgi:TetR/AcrR family transcriptional repressor of nem operon